MKTNHTFSVLFWINKSKITNGTAPLYARITVNGKRAEISLKRSIEPAKWVSESESCKGNSESARILNSYLLLVRGEIEKHYNQMLANNQLISAETIKSKYTGKYEKQHTLADAFEHHNAMMKSMVGLGVEEDTWGKYVLTQRKIEAFLKFKYRRQDISLPELNHKFVTDFEFYLKTEDKLIHNTAMKHIMQLKKVVSLAIANEWLNKYPFNNFKCSIKEVQRNFLTQEQLDTIANFQFADIKLEQTRDIFLFQAYTGYAYAEVAKLSPDNLYTGIDGFLWLSIQRKKTRNKTVKKSNVPLLPVPLQLIDKYKDDMLCKVKNTLLPMDTNSNLNTRLKTIAKLCGIKTKLTTHIARHSFATSVTLANGVSMETVGSMLGHSSIRSTQIYAKIVDTRVSNDMLKLREKMGNTATPKIVNSLSVGS